MGMPKLRISLFVCFIVDCLLIFKNYLSFLFFWYGREANCKLQKVKLGMYIDELKDK